MNKNYVDLSVVTTSYNSENHIEEFLERLEDSIDSIGIKRWEIIIVDDGSSDRSTLVILNYLRRYPMELVVLSRNWGHAEAIREGLSRASGHMVFLIDSDLEEKPEWLLPMWKKKTELNCDVVFGVQAKRRGGFLEKLTGFVYYRSFRLFTGIKQPINHLTLRLMSRDYVSQLNQYKENELNLGATWASMGFNQVPLEFEKPRLRKSTYRTSKKISLFLGAIISHTRAPLNAVAVLGVFFSGISFVVGAYWVLTFFLNRPMDGFTSIITSIWLLGGVITLSLSVVAIYLGRVFEQVKSRPIALVKKVHSSRNLEDEEKNEK